MAIALTPEPWVVMVSTSSAIASGCLALLGLCSVARAELVVSVYTGTSHTWTSDLRVRQSASSSDATFHNVHWSARPFQTAPYYGIRVSYFPHDSPRLGGTFDFTHYKMYADTNRSAWVRGTWNGSPVNQPAAINTRIQNFEISHGVNLTSLNVQYRWRGTFEAGGGTSRWEPHVGVGVVGYLPHAEGSFNGVSSSANYPLAGFGGQMFAGAEYRLYKHVGLLVETKFDAGSLDIDLTPSTRVETDVRTLHVLGGLALHF
jgi:hypothetical protein